jgi:ADP-ribose pyrophosphatase
MATIENLGGPQIAEGIVSIDRILPPRLLEMADNGEITDAAALACILKARLRGLI